MLRFYLENVKCLTRKNKKVTWLEIQGDLRSLFEHSQLSVNRILLRTPRPGIYIRNKEFCDEFQRIKLAFCQNTCRVIEMDTGKNKKDSSKYTMQTIIILSKLHIYYKDCAHRSHVLWNRLQSKGVQVAWSSVSNTFCCWLIKIQIISPRFPPVKWEGRGSPCTRCR